MNIQYCFSDILKILLKKRYVILITMATFIIISVPIALYSFAVTEKNYIALVDDSNNNNIAALLLKKPENNRDLGKTALYAAAAGFAISTVALIILDYTESDKKIRRRFP